MQIPYTYYKTYMFFPLFFFLLFLFPLRGLFLFFVSAIFSSAALSFTFCFIRLLWPGRRRTSADRHVCCRAIYSRAVRNRPFHLRIFIRSSFSFPYEVVKVHGGLSRSFSFHLPHFCLRFLCRPFTGICVPPIKPFPTCLTLFCGDDICGSG